MQSVLKYLAQDILISIPLAMSW